ncbi:MAG: cytochrome ubiquinol oxidase subunit I [Acidimicrobiia bacterium]
MLAVDPVPWARAQMAFTLGAHIILVPLGVAWAFMILVAERQANRHDDPDARELARRWSKVLAVTFAVGAVTGTVLTFEFGLLWPRFMGRYGAAFGIPFAIEGLFFFLEAIFLAVYIYGWDRLSPRAHWWAGVPIVLSGIGGTVSVIAANAWMNQPAGFVVCNGHVTKVQPLDVILNRAFPYEAVHMLIAAYLVGGFLIASVYAVAMLRGRRDRYHRLGFLIAFTVAAVAAPIQVVVGDGVARAVAHDQPEKFAAIELVTRTGRHVPETLGGYLDSRGREHAGIRIPSLASLLTGYSPETRIRGLRSFPASARPTYAQTNVVHLAWDVMVGLGTALALLALWFGFVWWRRRDLPRTPWFLRAAAVAGIASVVALEAGWVVTEVGRQPWLVRNHMKVPAGATTDSGVWVTCIAIFAVYGVLAVTTILVLRSMARRWRAGDHVEVPYSPGETRS